jgi:hypothetical protein
VLPTSYWFGICLIYLGLFILFFEVCFEGWFLNYHKLRYAALCVIILAGVEFSVTYVFFGAPLQIVASASDVSYSDGTLVDGISWQSGLSELRLSISDETAIDYRAVELSVRTDRLINQIVCIGPCPTCTAGYPMRPMEDSSLTPITGPGGQPTGPALPVRIAGVSAFTIRCDRLQHHTRLTFLASTFVPDKPIVVDDENTVHHVYSIMGVVPPGESRKAERVDIAGSYIVRGRVFRTKLRDALNEQEPLNGRNAP